MVPSTQEIVMQIRVLSELHPKDTISELASKLALSPIFIINALDLGEQMEWFQRKRDKKGEVTEELEILVPTDWESLKDYEFGESYLRIADEIAVVVGNSNRDKQDIEFGAIMAWCRGVNPSAVEVALEYLTRKGEIISYEIADPADKKSVYTFYTQTENKGKQWGTKQFKPKKGKK